MRAPTDMACAHALQAGQDPKPSPLAARQHGQLWPQNLQCACGVHTTRPMSSCLAKRRWRTTETAFLVAMRAAVSLSMAIRRLHSDDMRWALVLTQMATRGSGQAVGSVVILRDTSGSSLHILSRRHHQSSQINLMVMVSTLVESLLVLLGPFCVWPLQWDPSCLCGQTSSPRQR